MRVNLYPDGLLDLIRKKKKYIPRKLRDDEKLRLYRKYWIPEYGVIKVKEIININDIDYYIISYSEGYKNGVIPDPINCEESYELLKNYNQFDLCDIINKKKTIYGAEIKYWFTINEIENDDENYSGFLDKIQYLKDSFKYIVRRNKKKQEYEFIPKK